MQFVCYLRERKGAVMPRGGHFVPCSDIFNRVPSGHSGAVWATGSSSRQTARAPHRGHTDCLCFSGTQCAGAKLASKGYRRSKESLQDRGVEGLFSLWACVCVCAFCGRFAVNSVLTTIPRLIFSSARRRACSLSLSPLCVSSTGKTGGFLMSDGFLSLTMMNTSVVWVPCSCLYLSKQH